MVLPEPSALLPHSGSRGSTLLRGKKSIIYAKMEMSLFIILATSGEIKTLICLSLALSRVTTYRKDETKARNYACVNLAVDLSYLNWELSFCPGARDQESLKGPLSLLAWYFL
jgi:hypothetical protein